MFKTDRSTTGKVVSTLGVLTVIADNRLREEDADVVSAAEREMRAIARGNRRVPSRKVFVRTAERCAGAVWN